MQIKSCKKEKIHSAYKANMIELKTVFGGARVKCRPNSNPTSKWRSAVGPRPFGGRAQSGPDLQEFGVTFHPSIHLYLEVGPTYIWRSGSLFGGLAHLYLEGGLKVTPTLTL